jgi:cytochrome P450
MDALDQMTYLEQVVLETKRACANVPVSFGKAKTDFVIGGFTIPKGTFVFMSVYANNIDGGSFSEPEKFDPDRFSPGRAEHQKHKHAYQPQGAGPETGHRCAGVDFSSVFMKAFTALSVRDLKWTLPEQDLEVRWDVVPPEPKDGLRAVVERVAKK